MGNYSVLKKAVSDVIRPNAVEDITGSKLQAVLLNIISTFGRYSLFGGIATPSTSQSSVDQNVFYIATQTGTYPNFGNIYVSSPSVIYYDTMWRVQPLGLTESGSGGSGGDSDGGGDTSGDLIIYGSDSLIEGESYDYDASDPRAGWSIESGAMGYDVINVANGTLTTDGNVGQTRTLVIKAARGANVCRKDVKVYAKDSGNGDSGNGEEPLVITGSDEIYEGSTAQYSATPYPESGWSIVSGAVEGDSIDTSNGTLTTAIVGQSRTIVIKAADGDNYAVKSVKVKIQESIYPEGGTITGDAPLLQETTYHLNLQPVGVNVAYEVEWSVSYSEGVEIVSSDKESCTVRPLNSDYEEFLLVAAIRGVGFNVWASQWIQKGEAPVYDNTDTIIIDQRELDVTIGGEVNNTQVQIIRGGSHRYLGKFSAGIMHICQLKDDDGTKYWDGTDADLTGAEGDVFMRLPKFYYRVENPETDLFRVTFKAGNETPTEDGWKIWDGNDLIGVYKAYVDNNERLRSVSGYETVEGLSKDEMKVKAKNRNLAFSLVKWKHHCMMAHLFMAKYGSTNSQDIIGNGIAMYEYTTGLNDKLGMTDTIKATKPATNPVNYWGLEGWWGGLFEWIDNVVVNGPEWTVTEGNGTFKYTPCLMESGFISKLGIGEDLHAFPIVGGATSTTGYCDAFQIISSDLGKTDLPVVRSGIVHNKESGIFNCCGRSDLTNVSSRLAYSGSIIEVSNVEEFKAITNWK